MNVRPQYHAKDTEKATLLIMHFLTKCRLLSQVMEVE